MAEHVIHTCDLRKTYRRFEKEAGLRGSLKSLFNRKYVEKHAVVDFNLDIGRGEFVGLIGPNGAGKTTLVKMLTGIIAPSGGEIDVLGFYPNRLQNELKRQYAVVMGQKSQLFFELTTADTLQLFQTLYAIPQAEYLRNVGYFVELFDVKPLLDVQVRTLSLGERMKMELIVALLHDPAVLFLDEPTIGLDAAAQRQIRQFLKEVNQTKHTTILLTSHYMEDVRSLCPRSVVINGGQKLYDGDTEALFEAYQTHRKITVRFNNETDFTLPTDATLLERDAHRLSFMLPKERAPIVLSELTRGYSLADISIEEEDIGSVVERIYAGEMLKIGEAREARL
ncbi:multidrug ABC transporter ATP-binding protein [Clostridia bacterium]|nr:multidrug ABC transporter ATP-binding protein [Clostridia bacterium]